MTRRIGRRQIDDDRMDTIEDAAVQLWCQGQADVASMDATTEWCADGFVAPGYVDFAAAEFKACQIVYFMFRNQGFDNDARIIGKGCRQVDSAQDIVERATGDDPTFVEQNQMVGQSCDLIRCMADIDDRYGQFAVQAFEIRQDLQLALEVECSQRFVHEQDFRIGEEGAGDGDALAFAPG